MSVLYVNHVPYTIQLANSVRAVSQTDPAKTVQIFIDLIQRHEQSFYSFVHKVHSKGEGLFTGLMRWIELFLTLMRDGVGERLSLEFLLPHTGADRENIMREVDEIALYHYKLKVAYEAKLRRRFGRTQGMNDADAEDEAAAQLVNGVVRDLSFGELVKGDADDLAAQETDDEDDSSDEDSGSGSGTSGSGSDESDSDESDETDSEESSGGSDTERDGTPFPDDKRLPQPPTRSRTVGHTPVQQRPPQARFPSQQPMRHSVDTTRDERPPPVPPRERPRTLSNPARSSPASSRFKDLPPPPPPHSSGQPPRSARQQEKRADRQRGPPGKGKAASKPKKSAAAPQPPELEHIPKLLPLFVEMVRT